MRPNSTPCALIICTKANATDEVIYQNFKERLEFRIGDVRDFHSLASALTEADVVFNAAALKQVPILRVLSHFRQ